jgi:hypothetical protein
VAEAVDVFLFFYVFDYDSYIPFLSSIILFRMMLLLLAAFALCCLGDTTITTDPNPPTVKTLPINPKLRRNFNSTRDQ